MTVLLETEPDSAIDVIASRTPHGRGDDRAKLENDIAAFLAGGGQITTLPPCVSSVALQDAAKRSLSILTEEQKAKRGRTKCRG